MKTPVPFCWLWISSLWVFLLGTGYVPGLWRKGKEDAGLALNNRFLPDMPKATVGGVHGC